MPNPLTQQLLNQPPPTTSVNPLTSQMLTDTSSSFTGEPRGIDYLKAEEEFGEIGQFALARQRGRAFTSGATGFLSTTLRSLSTTNQMLRDEWGIDLGGINTSANFANQLDLWLADNGLTQTDPRLKGDWISDKIPNALGNMSAQLAAMALTRKIGMPAWGTAATSFSLLGLQAGQSEFERALAEGATRQEAYSRFRWNFAVTGAIETVVLGRMLNRFGANTSLLKRMAANVGENAASGALEVISSDIIAGREIDLNEVGESALLEAIAGGILGSSGDITRSISSNARKGVRAGLAKFQGQKPTDALQELGMTESEAFEFVEDDLMMPNEALGPQPLLAPIDSVALTTEQQRRVDASQGLIADPALNNFLSPDARMRKSAVDKSVEASISARVEKLSTLTADFAQTAEPTEAATRDRDADRIISKAEQDVASAVTPIQIKTLSDEIKNVAAKLSPDAIAKVNRALTTKPDATKIAKALEVIRQSRVAKRTTKAVSDLKVSMTKAKSSLSLTPQGKTATGKTQSKITAKNRKAIQEILDILTKKVKGGKKASLSTLKKIQEDDTFVPTVSEIKNIERQDQVDVNKLNADQAELLSGALDDLLLGGLSEKSEARKEVIEQREAFHANVVGTITKTVALKPLAKGQAVGRDKENQGLSGKFVRSLFGKFEITSLDTTVLMLGSDGTNNPDSSWFYNKFIETPQRAYNDTIAYTQNGDDALLAFGAENGLSPEAMISMSTTLSRESGIGRVAEVLAGSNVETQMIKAEVIDPKTGKAMEIDMSKAQAMGIYAASHDPRFMDRVVNGRGDKKALLQLNLTKQKKARSFSLDRPMYDSIVNSLSQSEKNLAQFMVNYLNTVNRGDMAAWSTRVLDRDITRQSTYWPIKTIGQADLTSEEMSSGAWATSEADNQGITKESVEFSDATIRVQDIFLAYREHQQRVGAITQASEAFTSVTRSLNDPAVREAFNQTKDGKRALTRLENDYSSIVGQLVGTPVGHFSATYDFINKYKRNITVAAIALNPLVASYQVVSTLAATSHIPAQYIKGAMLSGSMTDSSIDDRMMADTEIRARAEGMGIGMLSEGAERGDPAIFARKGAIDRLMFMVRGMDKAAIRTIWKASELYVKAHPEMKQRGEGTMSEIEAISHIANKTINETQPTRNPFNQSGLAASAQRGSEISSLMSQFGSQRLKYVDMLYKAATRNSNNGPTIMAAMMSKQMGIVAMSATFIAVLQELAQMLFNENEENDSVQATKEILQRSVKNLAGIFPLGSLAGDTMVRFIDKLALTLPDDPFTVFGTSGSQLRNQGFTAVDSVSGDLLNDMISLSGSFLSEDSDPAKKMADLAITVGMVTGIPITVPFRDSMRAYKGWTQEVEGVRASRRSSSRKTKRKPR